MVLPGLREKREEAMLTILQPPRTDLRLASGRVLRYQGDFNPSVDCIGAYWVGPKGMTVLCTTDYTPHGILLHVSLSYPKHDPSWADIKEIRDAFFPGDIDCMMVLPRTEDYVNVHQHCFHVWQYPGEWGLQ